MWSARTSTAQGLDERLGALETGLGILAGDEIPIDHDLDLPLRSHLHLGTETAQLVFQQERHQLIQLYRTLFLIAETRELSAIHHRTAVTVFGLGGLSGGGCGLGD